MFCILFFCKIDLMSEIIDLNGDSLYVILSYFFKISNNSSSFNVFFLLLHPSYLQLTSIHALISFSHVVSPYLIIGKKKFFFLNIYKKFSSYSL